MINLGGVVNNPYREQERDSNLPHRVKTQYVHLQSKSYTPIEHTISLQSTPMLKSCINICLI